MPYDDKTIEDPKCDRWKDKKVDRCDAVGMVAQKRAPALRWRPRVAAHIPSDCRLSDFEAELEQFTMNVWSAPERVRPAHLANDRAQLIRDPRSANTVARSPAPIRSKSSAAGDVAGAAWRREEDKSRRDFFGLRGPFHRRLAAEFRHTLGRAIGRIERGPYRPRRDRIDADAFVDEMGRKRTHEGVDAALGHRIVEQVLIAKKSSHRAGHDDGTAFSHMRHCCLRHVEVAVQVCFQRAVEMFFR